MDNLAYSDRTIQSGTYQEIDSLCDCLSRIATIFTEADDFSPAIELIRESQYSIESIVPKLAIDDAIELIELGRILASWKFRWIEISSNPAKILAVRNLARSWYEQLAKMQHN